MKPTDGFPDGMRAVLDLGERGCWHEISSQAAAERAAELTRTAIAMYYRAEEEKEGRHSRRWFVLVAQQDQAQAGLACLAVAPVGAALDGPWKTACHVTGYQNRNPYPDLAWEIERLAEETGLPIEPNYMGNPLPGTVSP